MKIFLTGFMAAGKTTIGKQLANKLNYSFLDLDHLIEMSESLSIDEIFQCKGEAYFRQIESQTLRNLTIEKNTVISTGGGAPCFYKNMEWMNKEGITVYIDLKPEIILHRLTHSKTKRPLVEGKTSDDLLDYIKEQLKWREEYYRKARVIIKGESLKIKELIICLNPYI